MLRRITISAALVCAVAAPQVASVARADDAVSFTLVARGQNGPTTAQNVTIRDAAAYAAFFGGNPPATPAVDFTTENVVAVAMGSVPTSGYSVDITRVGFSSEGFVGPLTTVSFVRTSPAPGSIETTAFASPFCVVKIAKPLGLVAFRDATPAPAWDELDLSVSNTTAGRPSFSLSLKPDGSLHVDWSAPNAKLPVTDGAASQDELKAVNAAFAGARVTTLPKSIDGRLLLVVTGGTTVTLKTSANGQSYSTVSLLDHYADGNGDFTSRVKPLVDALRAIAARYAPPVPLTVNGRVIAPDGDVAIDQGGGAFMHVAQQSPFRAILSSFLGRNVTAFGRVSPPSYPMWKGEMDVAWAQVATTSAAPLYADASTATPGAVVPCGTLAKIYVKSGDFYAVALPCGSSGFLPTSAFAAPRTPSATPATPTKGLSGGVKSTSAP